MTMPFYVSPEQQMKDRADYARKGIAQGRSVIVMQYEHGIMFAAENPSPALHKISEIYDRIAFAAAGRYNEFENLRVAGVRIADTRGYSYDRRDVTARGLANTYAQVLGTIFSSVGEKPYEVEIVVAEVGEDADSDEIYRMTFHGSVGQERGFAVMGGSADQISAYVKERYQPAQPLASALRLAADALGQGGDSPRTLEIDQLEVAVLDRGRSQVRKFKRVQGVVLQRLLTPEPALEGDTGSGDEGDEGSAEAGESTDSTGTTDSTESTDSTDSAEATESTRSTESPEGTDAGAADEETISDAELDDVLDEADETDRTDETDRAGDSERSEDDSVENGEPGSGSDEDR